MVEKFLIELGALIVGSIICGALYRMGGADAPYKSWMRDKIIPLPVCAYLWHLGYHNIWALLLSYGLLWGALSTYNKWFGKLFGYNDGNVHWPSWLITGLFYGLSALPVAYVSGDYWQFGIRAVVLAYLTMWWSERNDNPVWEECGRGVIIFITLGIIALFKAIF